MLSKNHLSKSISDRFIVGLMGVICFWYLALCVMHWLGQRPLWLDEFNVFRSVRDFAPQQFFTQKLAGGQIYPKLALCAVQRVAKFFHEYLLGVRCIAFVSMTLGFMVWMKIAEYHWADPLKRMTYAFSWAGCTLLVYYAAELKPYSMDVLVAGLWILFICRGEIWREQNRWGYCLSLWILPLLGLLSYPAYLFFVFPAYHLLRDNNKDHFWQICVLGFVLACMLSLAGLYYFDIRWAKADVSSQGFDNHMVSFVSVGEFFKSWWEGTVNLFCRFFAEQPRVFKKIAMPYGIIAFGYMGYAFWGQLKRDQFRFCSVWTIALVIYGELFILGALQKYPFSVPRTSLFFCPMVLLLIVESVSALKVLHRGIYVGGMAVYLIFLTVLSFGLGQAVASGNLGFAGPNW